MGDVNIKTGSYAEIGADAHIVRDNVFIVEQNISRELERHAYGEVFLEAGIEHISMVKMNSKQVL